MILKVQEKKVEKYLFLFVTALNLLPVLVGKFYPTIDGAAHLYNSNLINDLIINPDSQLGIFFSFNHFPVPNWIGHFILSLFNLFLPAFMAEKILLLTYLIGLPYSFRALIKTIRPQNMEYSFLIFPFCYSFLFIMGFYNFSLGMILLLITLSYWIKNENKTLSIRAIIVLFILMTLTYFSHIFVFAMLLFLMGLHTLFHGLYQSIQGNEQVKITAGKILMKWGKLLVASFIPLLLFFLYFRSSSSGGNYVFLGHEELSEWLKNIRPIIAYDPKIEEPFTKKMFYLLASLVIIFMYERINAFKASLKSGQNRNFLSVFRKLLLPSDFWMITTIIVLILYFSLPDSDHSAGYVSVRLGLLFFIFLILWISSQESRKWLRWLSVIVLLYLHFHLIFYYSVVIKNLNVVAKNCEKAAEYIDPYSTVLPVRYSSNWLTGHFSNYLGIDKPMVILENYECGTGYFPLKWNDPTIPKTLLGNIAIDDLPCIKWKSNSQNAPKTIDYVFVLADFPAEPDSCHRVIKNTLMTEYDLVYKNDHCSLFRAKTE